MSDESGQAVPESATEPGSGSSSDGVSGNGGSGNGAARVRPGAILMVVVPIGLAVVGGFVFFGIYDGVQWLSHVARPARVGVAGRVLFNGEPLPNAVIATRPADGDWGGAIASSDEQGNFKLLTHLNGDFLDGAYVGEHQVTVKGYDPNVNPMFGPPPLLTPDKYASFDTSPLRIMVEEQGGEITLGLEGEANPSTAGESAEGAGGGPPGAGTPGGRGRRRPERDAGQAGTSDAADAADRDGADGVGDGDRQPDDEPAGSEAAAEESAEEAAANGPPAEAGQ